MFKAQSQARTTCAGEKPGCAAATARRTGSSSIFGDMPVDVGNVSERKEGKEEIVSTYRMWLRKMSVHWRQVEEKQLTVIRHAHRAVYKGHGKEKKNRC